MKEAEGFVQVPGGKVFWKSIGEGSKTPILTLHGGPGFSHNLLVDPFRRLAGDRRIIFYDQLGSGKSDRPKDVGLWRVERFVEEIGILRKELQLDEIILYGISWGSMLGMDYLLTAPKSVRAVILSNPCLSAKMWKADADRLRLKLPREAQETLLRHERAGTTSSEEYEKAMWEYLKRFACILDPIPQEITDAFADSNREIYNYMWGPSEFHPTGTLKNYDRTGDLGKITQPTLFICGRHDESTPEATAFYASKVPGSKFVVIEDTSHLAFMERPEAYMDVLKDFLARTSV